MTVLLLDVMGTLVHDPFYEDVPRFFGMSLAELIEVKHPTAWIDFELGNTSEEEFLRSFFADGRDYDHAGFRRAMSNAYQWLPGIESLLTELREGGTPMHVVSNYPRWSELIEERLGLSRYVQWSFVSWQLGVRKPHPAYFDAVIDRLGVPASACLFVDDRDENCRAAADAGMDAISFADASSLRRALADRGIPSSLRS